MAKQVKTGVKLNLPAGEATPAAPVGIALGQDGVAIMDFVKAYNEKTADKKGNIVPVVITIYDDRTFDFITKTAPVSELIKKKINLDKGSGDVPRTIVGKLTDQQLTEIATEKMEDLNTKDIEMAKRIVAGTARSMGVEIQK